MKYNKKVESKVSTQPVEFEIASHEIERSHNSKDIEAQSQLSSIISFHDAESGKNPATTLKHGSNLATRIWRATRTRGNDKVKPPSRKRQWCRWFMIVVVVLSIFGGIAAM